MLDVKTWARSKLAANSALVALLTTSDRILFEFPNDFELLPVVSFLEEDQPAPAQAWADNAPQGVETNLIFDVWVGDGQDTTAIAQQIDTTLTALLFGCTFSGDIGDPNQKIHHRHMRYSRVITPQELV